MNEVKWWSLPCRSHSQRLARQAKAAYERKHPLDGDDSIFSFVTRDGKQFAVAKSGREYELWDDTTPARLRRVQLRAWESVEEELIRQRRPTNSRESSFYLGAIKC